jgi:hypothetical protein
MSSCGTTLAANSIPNYSLSGPASTASPSTIHGLQRWLSANSPKCQWSGKLYVARTISWNGTCFFQKGCSPNYQAEWWTLTCCKHEMRSAGPINSALNRPNDIAVFIFTLAEQDTHGIQRLVSVAKVTEHFRTMADYANRLRTSRHSALISSRLTRHLRNDGLFGWRFGDCHSDRSGVVGAPHVDHEHGQNRGNCWATDNTVGHTLLMSDRFLIWPQSVFFSAHTLKQSRYGHNISPGNLRQLLK